MTDAGANPRLKSGLARVAQSEEEGEFDVLAAMGGVRGMIESSVPTLVFAVGYGVSKALMPCLVAAVTVAVVILVLRIVQRVPVTPGVSGLLGIGIAAAIAWWTRSASGFFLSAIAKNAIFMTAYLASVVVRWPLVGVQLGFILGEGTYWREVPARLRAYQWASALWALMFAIRLVVQVPMFRDDNVTGLGLASVPLGLPLFGLVLLVTWLIVRRVPVAKPPEADGADPLGESALDDAVSADPDDASAGGAAPGGGPEDEPIRSGAAG